MCNTRFKKNMHDTLFWFSLSSGLFFLYLCVSLINDSGIFAMKNLEAWAINVDMMDKLNEADICHLRIKYVNDMLSSPFNSADEGRFKVQEFDEVVILVAMSICLIMPSCF